VGSFYGPRGKDPDDFPQRAGEESLAEMAAGIARRVPKLADAGLAYGITGLYDTSPDHRPLLGEVPGVAGLHLVAGFSGMGFKISPAVGEAMAEWILDGRASRLDLRPFRPGRFAEGEPIRGEHEYEDE
jgi:glycine/D-amino acid oxidase-like deaminating enzyme